MCVKIIESYRNLARFCTYVLLVYHEAVLQQKVTNREMINETMVLLSVTSILDHVLYCKLSLQLQFASNTTLACLYQS